MDFGSINFLLVFLPLFLVLFWICPNRERNELLFFGSLIFVGLADIKGLAVLCVSLVINYELAKLIEGERAKKSSARMAAGILSLGIILNLSILFFFKVNGLVVGISFYSFTAIGYLIDVYKKEIKAEQSIVKFGAFLCMFPKLCMGPIVQYKDLERNLIKKKFSAESIQEGIKLLIVGLAAKILIADRLNMLWHELEVTGYDSISTPLAWIGALAFSLKLYFDFYGYSLMAIGCGKMLGIDIPDNFQVPYMCKSVREFYRCWHITLGKWFSRYVYIPMGGNRKGELRTLCNLFVVWVLTSAWHGFTLNYFIWGGILFLCISMERLLKIQSHIYLIFVIMISWVAFAITDTGLLITYFQRMFNLVPVAVSNEGDWISAISRYPFEFALGLICATPIVNDVYGIIKNKFWGWIVLSGVFWVCIWRIIVEGSNPFMYGAF